MYPSRSGIGALPSSRWQRLGAPYPAIRSGPVLSVRGCFHVTVEAPKLQSGARRVVDVLENAGVETVFGLSGVHNLALWDSLSRSPIRLIGVRHEQTAAYAADGYARTTGQVGVALVTTGPGAANTLAATGEAMASGSPVVVIATDIPSHLRRPNVRRGVLHESTDQAAMFAPVTKRATTATDPRSLTADLLAAADLALNARTGPVYLGIPTDYLSAPVPASEGSRSD